MHKYLGIMLNYREQGNVKINMTDYLKTIMDDLPDKYQVRAITPTTNHLFEFNETAQKLSKKNTHTLHTIVEKFLFLCKREWPDILTGVAFLTTRVREPDKDDAKKFSRMLKYISGKSDIVLTLESNGTGTIKWWVDAAFAVHHDMKSHTGGMMMMG